MGGGGGGWVVRMCRVAVVGADESKLDWLQSFLFLFYFFFINKIYVYVCKTFIFV